MGRIERRDGGRDRGRRQEVMIERRVRDGKRKQGELNGKRVASKIEEGE